MTALTAKTWGTGTKKKETHWTVVTWDSVRPVFLIMEVQRISRKLRCHWTSGRLRRNPLSKYREREKERQKDFREKRWKKKQLRRKGAA